MAIITTNTFLDAGVARTAGEIWTMNGGILTVRTDTRWHSNSPAGMLGSIGATTTSDTLSGGVLLDGRNVRQVDFNTGSGTVPAIGTVITQGSVSGYLLGVYASLTSAPTAVAAAMPTTGFIKFREVTGGAFATGALTGIGASATAASRVSWIEVVQDQTVANTVPRLGFFRTRGDWFNLDDATGVAAQILQIPTNGGGSGTNVPAIWVETGVATNVYEIYPALLSTWYLAANLSTDIRSKFVQTLGNGQIRIGFDGAANAGFVPPAGCRIRIPNVLGRQTSAVNRSLNLIPSATLANRPDFTTTAAGDIDFEFFMNDWYHLFASAFKVKMVNCATFDVHSSSNEAAPTELNNYACGAYTGGQTLTLINNALGGTITDCSFVRPDSPLSGNSMVFTGCSNYTISGTRTGIITYARSTGEAALNQCRNFVISDCISFCATLAMTTSSNIRVLDFNYIDRIVGVTNATTGKYAIQCSVSCGNIFVDGVILSFVSDLGPYLGVFGASNSSNLTFRNVGTYAARADVNAAFAPNYIFQDLGNNDGVRVQRCYLEATRTSNFLTINTTKNLTIENCYGTTGSVQTRALNTLVKGIRTASNSVTGGLSVYGTHFFDLFESDTAGRVWLALNEPTVFSADQYEAVSLGAGAGFTSAGQIVLPNVADQIIFTMPYFAIGHTAFSNSAPVLTGANLGNLNFEYDLDTGPGFSNVFKTLNAANLSAEIFTPTTGFKLKIRITTVTANAANALTYVRVNTNSTSVAQENNLYPLDTSTISLSGLRAGSRVQIFDATNSTELFNQVVAGTTLTFAAPFVADYNARIRVMYATAATADIFIEFSDLVTINGLNRSVTPVVDTVYVANAIDGFTVPNISIVDNLFLVEIDTPTLSWSTLYAFAVAWLYSQAGIRDEGQFVEALDQANYLFTDFQIKNVSSPSVPLTLTNGYGRDSVTGLTVTMIDNTGGTIFSNPDLVIPFSSGSGLSTAQDITLSKIDTLTENVGGLRYTTKALEQAGGSSLTLADIADAVWDEPIAAHLAAGSTGVTLNGASAPSAGTVASAVRTELTTELSRIDVAVSTRNAVTPTNLTAAQVRTELTTELSRIDVAVSTRSTPAQITTAQTAIIAEIDAVPAEVWNTTEASITTPNSIGVRLKLTASLLTVAKFLGLK